MSFFEFPHTRTYDSDLGWLIKFAKSASDAIEALEKWKTETAVTLDDLQRLLDNIESGAFPDNIANAIKKWIAANFYDIVGEMAKNVWFGLTDSGYFVAYIPESWRDIMFRTTGYDIETELQTEFGHLVLLSKY